MLKCQKYIHDYKGNWGIKLRRKGLEGVAGDRNSLCTVANNILESIL